MLERYRRIRANQIVRDMVRETRVNKTSLIYPLFVVEGMGIKEEIKSLPGRYRYSIDMILFELEELSKIGITKVLLFGIPNHKDELASSAFDKDGIIQKALRICKKKFPNIYYITDVCMCEYTSHGHCGIINNKFVDNDKTIDVLSKIALSQVIAGSDMVAPSDMMDGRILNIRNTLDSNGFTNIPIMSYSAKYSSSFYGPFREAANSAPTFGDRKSYQMDYHNSREALKETKSDESQGADIIMIKPALSYLDIISKVRQNTNLPISAYSVSGEYLMIKSSASLGYINENDMICETAISIYRAGADILITYFAKELANFMDEGRIG